MAEEIQNPLFNVPRSMLTSIIINNLGVCQRSRVALLERAQHSKAIPQLQGFSFLLDDLNSRGKCEHLLKLDLSQQTSL